jgi:hypothetical protein
VPQVVLHVSTTSKSLTSTIPDDRVPRLEMCVLYVYILMYTLVVADMNYQLDLWTREIHVWVGASHTY